MPDAPTKRAIGDVFNPYKAFLGFFIPDQLAASKSVTPAAKLVYGYLTRCAGKNGACYPSRTNISENVGCSERHVKRLIRELQDLKLIRVGSRAAESGRSTTNWFEFLWHPIFEANPNPVSIGGEGDAGVPLQGDVGVPLPMTSVSPPRGTSASPSLHEEIQRKRIIEKSSSEKSKIESPDLSGLVAREEKNPDPILPSADDDEAAIAADPWKVIRCLHERHIGYPMDNDIRKQLQDLVMSCGMTVQHTATELRNRLPRLRKDRPRTSGAVLEIVRNLATTAESVDAGISQRTAILAAQVAAMQPPVVQKQVSSGCDCIGGFVQTPNKTLDYCTCPKGVDMARRDAESRANAAKSTGLQLVKHELEAMAV